MDQSESQRHAVVALESAFCILFRRAEFVKLIDFRTAFICAFFTMFENHRKSLIRHCERSELRLHCGQIVEKIDGKCQH